MWKLRYQRPTQTLTRVDKWIYQYKFLQQRKMIQRTPGIISATEKNHWRQDQAEHESDVCLINRAAKRKPTACREKRHEQSNCSEAQWRAQIQLHSRSEEH